MITLNMRAAAACMNEFVARGLSLPPRSERKLRAAPCSAWRPAKRNLRGIDVHHCPNPVFARGDQEPLLGLPILGRRRKEAA